MTDEAALIARLHQRAPQILDLTERLVRINSHTRNVSGVNAVGNLLAEALGSTSLQLTRYAGAELGEHLCFRTPCAATNAVLLIGHHDTVFPQGGFEGFRREGDLACGPGVLDMKGGLALVANVLTVLHEADLLRSLPLCFVSVSDEEIGSPTSQALLSSLAPSAACALVFEAGRAGDKLITARRGSGHVTLTVHGKAAHAGNALSEGKNAIWALARFIDEAQSMQHRFPGASLNVGLAQGGSARNTVPDLASCEVDVRFSDAAGEHALREALEQASARAAESVAGTRAELRWTTSRAPWARSEASSALARRYAECQGAAGLLVGEADIVGGGSDANTLGALGVPTIDGLGPRGTGFHTHDERIEVASLTLKAEALLRFLLDFRARPAV